MDIYDWNGVCFGVSCLGYIGEDGFEILVLVESVVVLVDVFCV